jgi:Protein of unknown function (DUF1469).
MDDNMQLFELLWKKTVEYGKTSIELTKLRMLDNVLNVISSLIPPVLVFFFAGATLLFLSLGLALWLDEVLENAYYGYIIVATFFGLTAMIVHLYLHKRIKRIISDYIIKQVFK